MKSASVSPFVMMALLAIPLAAPAWGQYSSTNRDVLTANTGVWPSGGVILGDTRFVVKGLVGAGFINAATVDPVTGESFGSISDLVVSDFLKSGNGTYSGTFQFLPDRGYNSGTTFSNYAARINVVDFTFAPHTSAAITTPNQINMTFAGSQRFTYDHDANSATPPVFTTGLNANGTGTLFGTTIPVVTGPTTQSDGTVNNRLTVDSEGLVLDNRPGKRGSGWISDEYGAHVYHFNSAKEIDGILGIPAALVPHNPVGTTNFNGTPVNGRRDNQGFEGLAQSPDGTKLYALLQSATVQDSGTGNQGRANAVRLLQYDVSGSTAPTDPTAQYVIQLPRIDDNGGTPAVNRAGAQSALLMINDHQFLVLSRDGNGRGASGSPVFKSILLVDLNGATNIDGLYDAEGNQTTSPAGVLRPTITPLSWIEALNMLGKLDLSITELEQFGLNLNTAPGNLFSLSEKWEGLGWVSALDPANPNDFFVFLGNDNDFLTGSGKHLDASGALQSYDSGLENNTAMLAFRVTAEPLPEPASLTLLVAGGLCGLFMKRRNWRR